MLTGPVRHGTPGPAPNRAERRGRRELEPDRPGRLGAALGAAKLRPRFGREVGILLAGVVPITALVLGAIGVFKETTAVWAAISVGLVTLAVEGVPFARIERLGLAATVVATVINLALGLLVVAMKVLLAH